MRHLRFYIQTFERKNDGLSMRFGESTHRKMILNLHTIQSRKAPQSFFAQFHCYHQRSRNVDQKVKNQITLLSDADIESETAVCSDLQFTACACLK